jgi:branched-subunit amino acid ABC-type transport system permease component
MIYITFLLLGLGAGAVYAALGMNLVITYRASGVINFATGAMATYSAYVYATLRNSGGYFIPIPGLPTTIDLGGNMAFWPAVLITLVTAALLGLVIYLIVFRPLRSALPLAKVVASLGVMIILQSLIALRLGANPVSVPAIFPQHIIELGGARVPVDRFYLTAAVVLIAVAVWALYRFTRFGLNTRGSAESERGAIVVGLSPDRIAAFNWMLGSMIAGISGILISPIVPLVPAVYTLFIVAGLAAALVGQFTYIGPTVVAGFALGAMQSLTTKFQSWSWFPKTGVADAFPVIVIILVLIFRGRPLPDRGALITQTLPQARKPKHLVMSTLVGCGLITILTLTLTTEYRAAFATSLIMAVIGLSYVVITGYVGQISLAQLAIAGLSAFMLSRITTDWGIPFPISILLSAAFAAVVGTIAGLPALRVRGVNLAVVTIGVALAIEAIYFNNIDLNGGQNGARVKAATFLGIDLKIGGGAAYPRREFVAMVGIVLVLCALLVASIRRSRLGSQMLAVRANERAAAAAGIDVRMVKLVGFAAAAMIAGVGGGLMGYQSQTVSAEAFDIFIALAFFALVYLAGMTQISGAILAGMLAPAGLFYVAFKHLVDFGSYYELISGIFLIDAAIRHPAGLTGTALKTFERLSKRRSRTDAAPAGAGQALLPIGPPAAAPREPTAVPAEQAG